MSNDREESTLDQLRGINEKIQQEQPMVGCSESPESLLLEYKNNELPGFVPGINYLGTRYRAMRRIRGDGNCFYRAFLFSYLENLFIRYSIEELKLAAVAERDRFHDRILRSKEDLVALGYSEMAIESFHDMLLELVSGLFTSSREDLLSKFQEDGESDYYTWFMRLLTAGNMRKEAERFAPFLSEGLGLSAAEDVEAYCKREVEPMGKECEQIQIVALIEYLGVVIRIEYLDGRPFETEMGLPSIILPETVVVADSTPAAAAPAVYLLYRPGHYDILYV